MNKSGILVADSGGTGTEWCFVAPDGDKTYFSGRSYHPLYWNDDFLIAESDYWQSKKEMLFSELHFFGAGCLSDSNALKMKEVFHSIGFSNVNVQSDLHAAAFSALQNKNGSFAILGTGSVAAEMIDGNVQNITGGLGYLLGDEGSGYYFGKLLIQKLLKGELPNDLTHDLFKNLGSKPEILQNVYGSDGRAYLSALSRATAVFDHSFIHKIHKENIELFFNQIKPKLDLSKGISFVGSYAYYLQDVLRETAKDRCITINSILEKPIEQLTEYLLNNPK